MASGVIKAAWRDATHVRLAVMVPGDSVASNGSRVAVEYIGSIPLSEIEGLTASEMKSRLVAAASAARAASLNVDSKLPITGAVEL